MKTNHLLFLLLSVASLGLPSCVKDKCTRTLTYTTWEPVYKTLDEIHSGTATREAPRALKTPGQINYYDDKMFVVEKAEGIHVIDNANPSSPVNTDFISVPGITDLSIKNGYLFVNSFIDLLVIDLHSFEVVGRTENLLQPLYIDPNTNQVLIEYKEKRVTEEVDCESADIYYENGNWVRKGEFLGGGTIDVMANESAGSNDNTGIGGSLSHFTIIGDYLYTILHDGYNMEIYDISNPTSPSHATTVNVGVHLETLFPYGDKLFVGSNVGMYIYDNSNPLNPVQLSVFEHARACDPVFVSGNYAYVTLWDGSACGAGPNQLDVIDITDLTNPKLKQSFSMKNPHGLSVKGDNLLLCEGDHGLEIYDCSIPEEVGNRLLDKVEDFNATDVISLPGSMKVAMVIGEDGFFQYDFSDPNNLKFLSKITIEK